MTVALHIINEFYHDEDDRIWSDLHDEIRNLEGLISKLIFCATFESLRKKADELSPKIDDLVAKCRAKKQILLAWTAYDLHDELACPLGCYWSSNGQSRRDCLSDLNQQSSYRKRYNCHPVQAFEVARAWPCASHILDATLSKIITKHHYFGDNWFGDVAPRISAGSVLFDINYGHGLYCIGCRSEKCRDLERVHEDFLPKQWTIYGLCDDCVIANRSRSFLSAEKEQIKERKFRDALSEKRRIQNEQRASIDADFRKRRDAARVARERGKIERDAAYELVKELGILDLVRARTEESNETSTTN